MKKKLIIISLIFAIAKIYGQDYFVIDFAGIGVTPESVSVENLTQNTIAQMEGTDVLHLILVMTGMNDTETTFPQLTIYPNPMEHTCNITFYNAQHGKVSIRLYSITGKQVYHFSSVLSKGVHSFSLSGVPKGAFIIKVNTISNFYTGRFVSVNPKDVSYTFTHNCEVQSTNISKNSVLVPIIQEKNTQKKVSNKSIVEMNYTIGDELKLVGFATGFENDTIYDSPNNDKTYFFQFTDISGPCDGITQISDFRDGNVYNLVEIGDQCWFAENLKYLPVVHSNSQFQTQGISSQPGYGVYEYFGSEIAEAKLQMNYITYGVLYNWWAAMTACPTGWHLPSDAEWKQLEVYLGMPQAQADATGWRGTDEGGKLKSTTGWNSPNTDATDIFGFSAFPGGYRFENGTFHNIGEYGHWWSSTEVISYNAWNRIISYNYGEIFRGSNDKENGRSVRCLKD
jgi:uncharacterized protein (TIGR02145 family)